jgi:tRNA(fMet)-specific endonuclease VapC
MLIRYLLDTNTVSHFIRTNTPAVQNLLAKIRLEQVAVSTLTEAELLFGLARKPEAIRLAHSVREFLLDAIIMPWDSKAAHQYAEIRAELEQSGQLMGNLDMMIAAQALAENIVLVTNDAAFRRIKRLNIEDWTRP